MYTTIYTYQKYRREDVLNRKTQLKDTRKRKLTTPYNVLDSIPCFMRKIPATGIRKYGKSKYTYPTISNTQPSRYHPFTHAISGSLWHSFTLFRISISETETILKKPALLRTSRLIVCI